MPLKNMCETLLFSRLNFQFCPSSKVHGFSALDLKPNGDNEVRTRRGSGLSNC